MAKNKHAYKAWAAKPRPVSVGRFDIRSMGDWWYVVTAGASHTIVHKARTQDEAIRFAESFCPEERV